jgi:hypothetical protein
MKPHPRKTIILVILLTVLGLGGIGGGSVLAADPSGRMMQLPPGLLDDLPIANYFLPGLFLILIMGILPLASAYGLISGRELPWAEKVNPWPGKPWSWSLSLLIGLTLIVWIVIQILLWGEPIPLQIFYLLLGAAISGLTWLIRTNNHQSG